MRLFRCRQFTMGNIVAFIYGTALFGSTYLLPVFLQLGLELSASHVGTLMLPAGFVLALTIAWVGRLADRRPTHALLSVGLALLALSFGLMVLWGLGRPCGFWWVWSSWAVTGLGLSCHRSTWGPRDRWIAH